jgi:hypothetical protein
MMLAVTALRTDGGTQPRGRLDEAVIARYAEDMRAGLWDFAKSSDPITAFFDGQNHWLSSGYHRTAAANMAGLDEVETDVRQGSQRDAILFSVGANATHGHPRSDDDKRRAVSRLLGDPEWSKWSDREIARRCSVTPTLVGKLRSSLSTVDSERTYTTRHGTVATMDTAAIGKRPVQPASPDDAREAEEATGPAPQAGWRLPDNASGGVHALARSRGIDAATNVSTHPVGELHTERVGELRVDPSLPGGCTYQMLKHYLDTQRPPLPSQTVVAAMTPEHLATIRQLVEAHHAWAGALLSLLDGED